jgi:hypothetical protein
MTLEATLDSYFVRVRICAGEYLKLRHGTGLLTGPFFSRKDFCKYGSSRGESQGAFARISGHELLANCGPFACKSGLSAQTGRR